eukprot:SAG11_NODE_67_length_18762_cov_13.942560_9_plen_176_part_00
MRKLLITLLSILSIYSYGQTKLDFLIFEKVNNYRIDNGLSSWVWDDRVFLVAEKHDNYQLSISDISHEELVDVEGYEEINRLAHRFDSVFTDWLRCGENIAVVNTYGMKLEEIANKTLEMWVASPEHNKILLSVSRYCGGAISSHHSTTWSRSRHSSNNSWVYVTLNLYGGSIYN